MEEVSEVSEVWELSRNFGSVGTSGNLGSVRTFQNLQKRGNNLQKPWNASVSSETLEGYLVDILTVLTPSWAAAEVSFSYYLFYFIFNECSGHYCPLFSFDMYLTQLQAES